MVSIRNSFILLTGLLFCFCSFVTGSYAATINAKSASYSDISDAISAASPGDTVNVPAGDGTETWGSTLSITKGINLIGPGKNNLTITTASSGYGIYYNPNYSVDTPFRISGFRFNGGNCGTSLFRLGNSNNEPTDVGNNKMTKTRIDNNIFYNTCQTSSGPLIWMFLGVFGVIDNNEMYNGQYAFRATSNTYGDNPWTYWAYYPGMEANDNFGHGDNIFVEDNTIVLTNNTSGCVGTSSQGGMRWVFRYNDIEINSSSDSHFDAHGNLAGQFSSVQGSLLYGNDVNGKTYNAEFHAIRGGQSLVFYNDYRSTGNAWLEVNEEHADSEGPGPATNAITGQPQHVWKSYFWNNRNDTTGAIFTTTVGINTGADALTEDVDYWNQSTWNEGGSTVTSGCGCGTAADMAAITTCSEGVGFWATDQSCADLTDYVGANPTSEISGSLYICNDSNTWVSYYTPYAYPHPLRKPSSPQNLRIVNP